MMKNKICSKCHIEKRLSEFYFRKDYNIYRTECKECHKKLKKNYYKENSIKLLKEKKKYYKLNKKSINKKDHQHKKQRAKIDINFRLKRNLRCRLISAINHNQKSGSMIGLLGCSIEFLKKHLESTFTKGMTWEKYGKWHIDHKIPCSKFDLSKPEEQRKCFNYKNLQPLWALENKQKSNK